MHSFEDLFLNYHRQSLNNGKRNISDLLNELISNFRLHLCQSFNLNSSNQNFYFYSIYFLFLKKKKNLKNILSNSHETIISLFKKYIEFKLIKYNFYHHFLKIQY